ELRCRFGQPGEHSAAPSSLFVDLPRHRVAQPLGSPARHAGLQHLPQEIRRLEHRASPTGARADRRILAGLERWFQLFAGLRDDQASAMRRASPAIPNMPGRPLAHGTSRQALFITLFSARHTSRDRVVPPTTNEVSGRDHTFKRGKRSMRTRTLATALSVVGALFALSACETPSMDDFNSLRNQVA